MKEIIADELIIGAGLTGLMYGIVSAGNEDYKVVMSESHFKAGGYATNFKRIKNTFVFDCSQHKITGLGENGNLLNALVRAGVYDKLKFEYFDSLATIIIKDKHYYLPSDSAGIKKVLLDNFSSEREGIERLFVDIKTHGYQNYMFARMLLGEYVINKDILPESRALQQITTKEYLKSLFKNKDLIEMISSIALYLGALANEANAFYFLHYLYAAFEAKPAYIKGTSQKLSDTLAKEYLNKGGALLLKNPVISIEVEDRKIVSVTTKKYKIITNKVIATCSPEIIMNMIKGDCDLSSFNEKLKKLEIGWGHFSVYIVANEAPLNYGLNDSEYLVVDEHGDDLEEEDYNSENRYKKLTLSITNYHLLDPQSGPIIQLTILDHEGKWFSLEKKEYKKEKERVQNILLERTFALFPALKGNIKYVEASTPKTNFRYTNSPKGSAFGYKVLPKENMRFLYNPPVEGLKFVGGWSTGPGYETGMCLGFTHALLEKRKLKQHKQLITN